MLNRRTRLKIFFSLLFFNALMLFIHFHLKATNSKDLSKTLTTTDISEAKGLLQLSQRQNMTSCRPIFGRVTIFVTGLTISFKNLYGIAQGSLRCYQKTTNYTLRIIDLETDKRVLAECKEHTMVFFKKHCAAAAYLNETDWMLVLDADTAVVNPNHCIEEWIDPRVDVIFYERFFNWEIASGNYLAKNTRFAYDFLKRWAHGEFVLGYSPSNGYDNGILQMIILQTVMPKNQNEIATCNKIWRDAVDYYTYMAFVTCVKVTLGAKRIWPGQLRIYRRAHAWVRDGHLTENYWCDSDFMLHDFKGNTIGGRRTPFGHYETPFSRTFNDSECGKGLSGWHYRSQKHVGVEKIREMLKITEVKHVDFYPKQARIFPWLEFSDVGDCWPHCDMYDIDED